MPILMVPVYSCNDSAPNVVDWLSDSSGDGCNFPDNILVDIGLAMGSGSVEGAHSNELSDNSCCTRRGMRL